MSLKYRLKFVLRTLCVIVIFYVVYVKSREVDLIRDPPCYFNPLCTCSKAMPDLGIVRCQNAFLASIPSTINTSRVFMLQLDNIGLRTIKPHSLQNTGLYKLSITHNPIYTIPDDAFKGLERTLWKLDLSDNHLLSVPSKALGYLHKLKFLDLTGNRISRLYLDSWRGLEDSLETLILADNCIIYLSPDTFTGLPLLDTINLKGNNLREIDPSVFREGMDRLAHIILADNQLTSIPYLALSPLKMLQTLDLSYNRISRMNPTMESGNVNIQLDVRISLDALNLEYNQINSLESGAFQYFNILNKTYLDGNQFSIVEENAFRQAKIKEIYMRGCGLTHISPEVFAGLENYLQILDLSGNNLTKLDDDFLLKINSLRSLSLSDNLLKGFSLIEAINGFQHTLHELDLSGTRNDPISLDNLRRLRSLRVLHLSHISKTTLDMEDFYEFGADLEELHINFAKLQTVKNRVFQGVHGLKTLDLSENTINQIEDDAFADISHSLTTLQVSHGLSPSTNILPYEALKTLSNLQILDFSNNKIRSVPDTSFHFMKKLKAIELQDNEIEDLQKGTIQGNIHSQLQTIYLSFNSLKSIKENTFSDLCMLEQLHLDDNRITVIEKRAFVNLENIKRLNLKGNKIATISFESFQNLPELEDLDMSYNELTDFQFSSLDQVGTLATFSVNISHNKLSDLSSNYDSEVEIGPESLHTNIKILDLSYNNITEINKSYFHPVELSLTRLYISHNHLLNATRDNFGNMPHLQWLDLSFNRILEFDYKTFKNTRNLQALIMSNNLVAELPQDLFRYLDNLRIIDFSHNRMRFLPDELFKMESLERLDVSHNQLSRVPLSSLSAGAAATLTELDLSWNCISSLTHGEMFYKLESLRKLDLSHNRLVQIENGVFGLLPTIAILDLSHNSHLSIDRHGKNFQGIENSLLTLKLDNLSFTQMPELRLQSLISLSLAHNSLSSLPPDMSSNLSSLQTLDLTNNDLTLIPIAIHSLNNLKRLSLASNPLSILTNTSLLGVANHLEELDITELPLKTFESGLLNKMIHLETLKIGVYKSVKNLNIPRIIECNYGLKNLEIEVEKNTDLGFELSGKLPSKLRNIKLTGHTLQDIDSSILEGVTSPFLHFSLHNTSVLKISEQMFDDLHWLKNISVDIKDNDELQYFGNPLTASRPGLTSKSFLIDVSLRGNRWNCDCGLGWIETWQRRRRQYLCDNLISLPPLTSPAYRCRHVEDDIRNSICFNKANQSLIEVLKMDIECGWSSASFTHGFSITFILIVVGLMQL